KRPSIQSKKIFLIAPRKDVACNVSLSASTQALRVTQPTTPYDIPAASAYNRLRNRGNNDGNSPHARRARSHNRNTGSPAYHRRIQRPPPDDALPPLCLACPSGSAARRNRSRSCTSPRTNGAKHPRPICPVFASRSQGRPDVSPLPRILRRSQPGRTQTRQSAPKRL